MAFLSNVKVSRGCADDVAEEKQLAQEYLFIKSDDTGAEK